jgi:hypothetical protein
MQLRVEYVYDPGSRNWSFVVPALHIIGGAETRADAERQVIEAIEFALWSDAQEPVPEGVEIAYLTVIVEQETVAGRQAV